MACFEGRRCRETLPSLKAAFEDRTGEFFPDNVLKDILIEHVIPDHWIEKDIPLLTSMKNGEMVDETLFQHLDSPLGEFFNQRVRNDLIKNKRKSIYYGKVVLLARTEHELIQLARKYSGGKSRRFRKRQRKSKKRRR